MQSYLETQITKYNLAYRAGEPEISDEEYDALIEEHEKLFTPERHAEFLQTLMEPAGDVKHEFVIGSLKKCTYGKGDLDKFLAKHPITRIFMAEKLDGMSFVANYKNGFYTSAATRGDGYMGVDITAPCALILPAKVPNQFTGQVRGELTLTGDSHIELGFANRRNGTVGVIKKEEILPERLKHVKAYVFQIVGSTSSRQSQYLQLQDLGFDTPQTATYSIGMHIEEELKAYLMDRKEKAIYDIDGLVISGLDVGCENVYHPEQTVAFKVNLESAYTTVIGLDLSVSKGGLVKGVALLEPVELNGTTVKKATIFNMKNVLNNRIWEGAKVKVIKGGEIIPKIEEVVEGSGKAFRITECPSCGAELEWKGVDLACTSSNCAGTDMGRLVYFVKKMDIEGASEKSLTKWGINSLNDLFTFRPASKGQQKFYDNFVEKVFRAPNLIQDVFCNLSFEGGGSRTVKKMIAHYTWETLNRIMLQDLQPVNFPEGIGEKTVEKLKTHWAENIDFMYAVEQDSRWNPKKVEVKAAPTSGGLSGKKFCVTGTLSIGRKEFTELLEAAGAEVGSLSSKTDYLVAGEKAGSKLAKAGKLGVTVLTEAEAREMMA